MDKYDAFVWSAYGASAICILAAVVLTLRAYLRAKRRISPVERNRE